MHISDGVLSLEVTIVSTIVAFAFFVYSFRSLNNEKIVLASAFSALFFVASFIHIPFGPTQIHLMLLGFIGVFLGSVAIFSISLALILQALLLGFGGVSSIGVNVLIMGIDARSPDVRAPLTDTMILFTIDPVSNTAGMISIPRDLWVKIPGSEYGKINTAYSIGESFQLPGGGPGLAVRTVEDLLGVPIQYYAQINFEAFVSFIDNIDGVKVTIPERIQLDIVNTDRSYWLDPGTYTLPGDLALAYVRNRSTSGGDFDRAQRQQQVIMAIRDRVLSFNMMPTLIAKAPQLYADLSSGIRTNLTLDQALSLAQKALSIPRDQILSRAINGSYVNFGTSPDGLSMLRPIPDKIRELRDEVFGGVSAVNAEQNLETILQEEGASISVRNASSQEGLAAKTAEYLRAKGLNVVEETNAAYQTYSTITFYGAKPYTLHYLVDLFKIIPSTRIVYAYDPAATVDLVLYLGDDFAANSTLP